MSKFILESLKPVNRHLLVVPHRQEKKTSSGVLLPEDYRPESEERHVVATVLEVADDCMPAIKSLRCADASDRKIIVDKGMIEQVVVKDKKYNLVLENYVLGIFKRPE